MRTQKILILFLFLFASAVTVQAQGFQRKTVEERVQVIHQKLDSAFKLDKAKLAEADSVFTSFYKETDKVRDEAMNGGGQPDFAAIREKMQPYADARDKKLQAILTEEQFKTWKEQIEPSLRPRRQQNGNK